MSQSYLQILLNMTAELSREAINIKPEHIATNLLKIHKLSKTLQRRNSNSYRYSWANDKIYLGYSKQLENKAKSLAEEIQLKVITNTSEQLLPFNFFHKNKEWSL